MTFDRRYTLHVLAGNIVRARQAQVIRLPSPPLGHVLRLQFDFTDSHNNCSQHEFTVTISAASFDASQNLCVIEG